MNPFPTTETQASTSTTNLLSPDRSRKASGHETLRSSNYVNSFSEKFSLSPNPEAWGSMALHMNTPEADDTLHNPDPIRDYKNDRGGHIFTSRGIANLGFLAVLALGMLTLFAGYPIISHFQRSKQTNQGGFNLGGTNATGQVAMMPGNFGLIDLDTPQSAYTKKSYTFPKEDLDLVFSDEFNLDGRTFYAGDDPYWEAADLHYWGTNDLEWYDPAQATTEGGALKLTLAKVDPQHNHDLQYRSGMVQTWNKFCFTGGLIESAVMLPGASNVIGLWPAIWTMGNLGRAGYGGTLEGMWPYTYDSCDVGTLPNQTYPGTRTPLAAVQNGDNANNDMLSYLPGQRLSACTCPGEPHPGPIRPDGSYVGRAAPEIDIFEATVEDGVGKVSQSAQWAPFNARYTWRNTSDNLEITDPRITVLNSYKGGAFQQTTSGLSVTNQDCYELEKKCYSVYGFEYKAGFDDGYITWINDGKVMWTIQGAGMGPDSATEIGARPIPQEPMYIIANLGFSLNFGGIDFDHLVLPTSMYIDYIRVYQPRGAHNIGCDPPDFPTAAYIEEYIEAYSNANLTGWTTPAYPQRMPKNRLNGGC